MKKEDLHDLLNTYHASVKPNESNTTDRLRIWEFMGRLTTDQDFRIQWGITNPLENVKDNSNLQQDSLLKIILGITLDSNIRKIQKSGKGQVWYLFANAVASYASYNPFYWVSEKAAELLNTLNIEDSSPISRSRIFQIRTPERKKILLFEHLCPATHLIELILLRTQQVIDTSRNSNPSEVYRQVELAVKHLFLSYGIVAIITKEEDANLKNTLRTRLDTTISNPMDQMLARYEVAGISLCEKLIPVFGKMYR